MGARGVVRVGRLGRVKHKCLYLSSLAKSTDNWSFDHPMNALGNQTSNLILSSKALAFVQAGWLRKAGIQA